MNPCDAIHLGLVVWAIYQREDPAILLLELLPLVLKYLWRG